MNPSDYPVEHGRYLIEASAGTGKTYTITHLILRLVLRGVPVRKILVTTFSNAAADELKARILALLNEELDKLVPAQEASSGPETAGETSSGTAADAYHPDLFGTSLPTAAAQSPEDMKSRILLQLAVSSIDEMTVSTIHGFCQKMLREFALKSGRGAETELIPDEDEYVERLTRAFCRERFYDGGFPDNVGYQKISRAASFAKEPADRDFVEGERLNGVQTLCRDAYRFVKERLKAEKERDGVMSFNDMIRDLDAALQADESLAKLIRARYQAVFVDEFQDTDRIQYRIFDRCFPRGCPNLFYMIGDPKQAIYGFRGADIYTYLLAKKTADVNYTLKKNFRSSPDMIRAVNTMFGDGDMEEGHETAGVFLQKDIPFVSIAPGKNAGDFPADSGGSLRLRHYVGSKDVCAGRIMDDVVREIRYLLSEECPVRLPCKAEDGGGTGDGTNGGTRPLRASDIAVLVQRHAEAADFVARLNMEGIAASACKSGKIYGTDEAKLMLLLIRCFLHHDMQCVRGLMFSPFFRISGEDAVSAPAWTELLMKQLADCGRVWSQSGFPAAFLQFLDTPFRGVSPRSRILSEFNGERVITNLIQLMELLYRKESLEHLLPEDLFNSLNRLIEGKEKSGGEESAEENPDQLRIDRDSASVQILTMFAAKGLEFPVVFIPYPSKTDWSHMQRGAYAFRVNTAAQDAGAGDPSEGSTVLDFGLSDACKTTAKDEEFRNSLRLLYVALTRASAITYLYTQQLDPTKKISGNSINFTKSATGVLMTSHGRPVPEPGAGTGAEAETAPAGETFVERNWKQGYYSFAGTRDVLPAPTAGWWTALDEPEDRENTAFHIRRNDVFERHFGVRRGVGPLRPEEAPGAMNAAEFTGEIRDDWAIMSFSAFHNILTNRADEERETPADLDEQNNALDEADPPDDSGGAPGLPAIDLNLFRGFPRGATVGSMTHRLLELCAGHFDLFVPESLDDPANLTAVQNRIAGVLREFGFDPEDDAMTQRLLDGVSRALRIPLPGLPSGAGVSLSELDQDRMAPEMEFFLDAPESLDLERILVILADSASDRARPLVDRERAAFDKNGVLNGIIDLVFEHAGKYYIVDWKTNWLGDSDTDYSPGRIRAAMGRAGYVLQSYLYAAALLQILRQRGLDYDAFGGVYYIFLRGLTAGTPNGIWSDVPPRECLERLLALFQKGNGK